MKERFDDYNEKLMEKIEKQAEELERAVEEDEEIRESHAPASLDQKIYSRIEEYDAVRSLSEKDMEALRLGRELQKNRETGAKKKRHFFGGGWKRVAAVFAVLAMTLGIGVNGIGGPERIVEFITQSIGKRDISQVDSSRNDVKVLEAGTEEEAYQEIEEMLGTGVVRVVALPEKMSYQSCEIEPELQIAYVLYEYEDETVSYVINGTYTEGSWGTDIEDEEQEKYPYKVSGVEITVAEYVLAGKNEKRYSAEFEYEGACYQVVGSMGQEDFKDILQHLYFP